MEHERTANALLLFYEKVQPKGCARPDGAAAATADHDGDQEMVDSSAVKAASEVGCDENAAPISPLGYSGGGGGGGGTAGSKAEDGLPPPPDNMSPATTESDAEGAGGDQKLPSGVDATGAGRRVGAGKVFMLDGVETYAEEVWEANVQYMLNSYVFDTEFHHFLRRVLLVI